MTKKTYISPEIFTTVCIPANIMAVSNINSNKHNIYYDKNSNPGLNGKTIHLPGGGKLQPMR